MVCKETRESLNATLDAMYCNEKKVVKEQKRYKILFELEVVGSRKM